MRRLLVQLDRLHITILRNGGDVQPESCARVACMDNPIEVARAVEFDLLPDELWELIADGERWAEWMVDVADDRGRARRDGRSHGRRRASRGAHRSTSTRASGSSSRGGRWRVPITPRPSSCASCRRVGRPCCEIVETLPPAIRSAAGSTRAWARRDRRPRSAVADCPSPRERTTRSTTSSAPSPIRLDGGLLERLIHDGPQHGDRARQRIVDQPSGHRQAPPGAWWRSISWPRQRHGREVRYRATTEPLAGVVDWLRGASASWDRRVERLRSAT